MMSFASGDHVWYRAIGGDLYDATVICVHENPLMGQTSLDLDIHLPGNQEPFHTTRVPVERCKRKTAYGPPFTTDVP